MKAILLALVLVGGALSIAAPAQAMIQWCTEQTGNCGWYLACVGAHYDANGRLVGCDHGLPRDVIPGCDPGSCDMLLP